ncbi:MAG: putative LPS assembly protein LptD [Cytophagales bacterium]
MKIHNRNIIQVTFSYLCLFLSCNLINAQDQNNNSKISSTSDAKTDSATVTRSGKKIVMGKEIETTVNYSAEDSIVFDVQTKFIHLNSSSKVNYGDRTLESDKITIDYVKNHVTAIGTKDSNSNKVKGRPVYKEGAETYVADKIGFNFATKKGVVYGAETKQGDGFIYGSAIKKNGDDELFVKDAIYTTCDRKHAHFGFIAHKIKIITNKKILSGPGQLQIGGTNLPIYLPFGYFPYPNKRSSGILMPSIGGSSTSGKFLSKLGFYWAINDYLDLKVYTDLYSNGGYNLSSNISYKVRYKFNGSIGFSRNSMISGFGLLKEKQPIQSKFFWYFNQEAQRKGKFSANVNITSVKYNRQTETSINEFTQQDWTSTVSYSRNFPKTGISLNSNARYNNNFATKKTTINLPDITLSKSTFQPFNKVSNWGVIKNINISASLSFKNTINNKKYRSISNKYYSESNLSNYYYDSLSFQNLSLTDLSKFSTNGGYWNISLNNVFKAFKYFSITPGVNLNGNIYSTTKNYTVSTLDSQLYYTNVKGFYVPFKYNFSVRVNTVLYGVAKINKFGIKGLRHMLTPSVTYTLQPKINPNSAYYKYMFQDNPYDSRNPYSRFSDTPNSDYVYGAPSTSSYSEVVNFSITNSLELKVKNKKDTSGTNKAKIVKLIDNFSVNANYNMHQLKNKLSNISASTSTTLLNKLRLNGSASFDPYTYTITNVKGVETATLNDEYLFKNFDFKNNKTLARIRTLSANASLPLNPKFKYKNTYTPEQETFYQMYPYLRYADFDLPWNVNLSYNVNKTFAVIGEDKISSIASVNTNITLMGNWKASFTSTYNTKEKKWSGHNITINKAIHCWSLFFTWSPANQYATYTFMLKANSATLRDFVPINKRSNAGI